MTMRAVSPEEYLVLEDMVIALSRYHGDESDPDAKGLKAMLWGADRLGEPYFFEHEGSVVAYAIVAPYGRFHSGTRGLELVHFGVNEAARGQGVGAQFMEALVVMAKERGFDILKLTAGTERAQSFYEKIGFEKMEITNFRVIL